MSESRDSTRLNIPLMTVQRTESTDSMYKTETRPSSIPLAIPVRNQSKTPPVSGGGSSRPSQPVQPVHHHFISPAEWARLAHGLGAIRAGETRDGESETHNVVHPTCWYWPPKGMPEGLYRDVVVERSQYFIFYHVLSTLRWFLMILQIILGAIITALGHTEHAIPITVLAAVNTVGAGVLALMHNSGLPDRYRLNEVEFVKVEDYIKELLDTGIVENGQTVDSVLIDCFARFQTAKATVLVNMPDSYTMSTTPPREKPMILCPDPPAHFTTAHP
ncbi:hypothetical protein QBC37DRAFT_465376 [Rhypophila decipiens]|uniref:SMODS and SLOG-associating 2TM effector domain-containing protein n=1 Tax=Rhypophila decipiens TaxID=261697 RepID=A0AAN6YG61_9PEZI|nr:hypothetical protein QBC37DRAFT_465376 [Rhypophila decipiens]